MLSKKSRNNPILMEAYHVLLGHVVFDESGRYVAVENVGYGPTDGATKLRTLGLTRVHRIYDSGKNNSQAVFEAGKVFRNIGRGVHFTSRDNIYGCQLKTYIFYPVILAFYENDEQKLQLSAFTPRCITARIAIALAVKRFEKHASGFLVRAANEKKEGEAEKKREKKEARKEAKKAAKERREQAQLEKEAKEINEAAERE